MKFATIGHLLDKTTLNYLPNRWIQEKYIISPQMNINGTLGYFIILKNTAEEIMNFPREKSRNIVLEAAIHAQDELGVELIQLGALTTSVTKGGIWLAQQPEYSGFLTHGDSYTANVVCKTLRKTLFNLNLNSENLTVAIVGAYGIIGEAVTKILTPSFKESFLIGRRENQLKKLEKKLSGKIKTSTKMITEDADVIVTATNHTTALLKSKNLKEKSIIVDVSQPPNLSNDLCLKRPDIIRVDGGYVDLPDYFPSKLVGMPKGKLFACIVELIMQAMEQEKKHHIGSIDMSHLMMTEKWAKKYGFKVDKLTNFGRPIFF